MNLANTGRYNDFSSFGNSSGSIIMSLCVLSIIKGRSKIEDGLRKGIELVGPQIMV